MNIKESFGFRLATLILPFVSLFISCDENDIDFSEDPVKNKILVISDLHLGDRRSIDGGYGWQNQNRDSITFFLDYVISQKDSVKTLVIAGDLFDEWLSPMEVKTFADANDSTLSQDDFFDSIVETNRNIIDKFIEVKNAGIEIVYTPGNHDMLVTNENIEKCFGTGVITQARESFGMGKYEPNPDIVIEHSHRYDFFNAPDPISNKDLDQVSEASITPPGFFLTKIASSQNTSGPSLSAMVSSEVSELKGGNLKNRIIYDIAWKIILNVLHVPISEDKVIKTGIDGYTSEYSISDLIPNGNFILYNEAFEPSVWEERLTDNHSPVIINFTLSLLGSYYPFDISIARDVYIDVPKPTKKVIVFGHTHTPLTTLIPSQNSTGDVIYANSGSWVDQKWVGSGATCTFVEISINDNLYIVSANKYNKDKGVTRLSIVSTNR